MSQRLSTSQSRRHRHCRRLPCAQSLWPTRRTTANWQLRLHVVSTRNKCVA